MKILGDNSRNKSLMNIIKNRKISRSSAIIIFFVFGSKRDLAMYGLIFSSANEVLRNTAMHSISLVLVRTQGATHFVFATGQTNCVDCRSARTNARSLALRVRTVHTCECNTRQNPLVAEFVT